MARFCGGHREFSRNGILHQRLEKINSVIWSSRDFIGALLVVSNQNLFLLGFLANTFAKRLFLGVHGKCADLLTDKTLRIDLKE